MRITKILATSALVAAGLSLGACSSIRENRGYVIDSVLLNSVQPGIDNQRSVEMTLGRPTFTSQFGDPTWYYVSSTTGRKPFVRPRVEAHQVLAVKFGPDGDVLSADRTGIDEVVYLTPDGAETPTLGRERGFLEDLFGNIGTVGQPGLGGTGPGGPGR
ncbi:outer membrane protein assembly factor BamE [Qipengyuania flava]|uniref:outer membrane protein assembly factor BamE n=1 Tax=Qipengyuania aestuarii TaxID=2867241 RepID=UPI001C879B2D|nr:outer membrane protein assembly factor BamE [Qipengyuania aestuarii]MBX7536784.1 outer membrane protein assembly factor BamE [Qipengyuania aestuarii]MCA0979364.1 outer membrane protein assembly factor BamE [Qipengyuania flava]